MASSAGLMTDGPKMDWTRDNEQYNRFIQLQKRCKMIFRSALVDQTDAIKGKYLKYWMGTEGLPLIEKWENMGKLTYKGNAATSKNIDSLHTGPSWKTSLNQRPTK